MKLYWLRFLLLSTFVFWATGAAKYTHEALEHHGRDASVDDGDDDDDSSPPLIAAATPVAPVSQHHSHPPAKHPCPICQMLAAMVVAHTAPPALPPQSTRLISTLILSDRVAPIVHTCLTHSARGPPGSTANV
jgi:hypothetical protein